MSEHRARRTTAPRQVDRLAARLRDRVRRHASPASPAGGLDPVVPDVVPPALPGVRAAVHASPGLAAALAREWSQVLLTAGERPRADLALVEVADGLALPGPLRLGDVPLVVWVTAARPTPAHAPLLAAASRVYVALGSQLSAWRSVAPGAALLPPAGSGRVPGTPPALRHGVAVVADGPLAPEPGALVAGVVTRALRPLVTAGATAAADPREPGRPPVRLAHTDPAARLPRALTRATETTDPADVGALVATAAVLADAPRRAPDDTWALLGAAAAGTPFVGVPGLPVPEGLDVPVAGQHLTWRGEAAARLHQAELRDREGLRLARAVRRHQPLGARVARVVDDAGLARPVPHRTVSAVVATHRAHELGTVLENVGRQTHPAVELVLVLHGLDVDAGELKERAAEAGVGTLTVVEAAPELTLGACLNLGVDAAGGHHLAKLDDDNHYGPHYLADLVDAADASGAGVVGKWAHHVWLRGSGAVVLRYPDAEHRYTRRVQGGSMVFDGDLLRRLRFGDLPRGVDTDVLDRVLAEGVPIWSADRFNFVSVRAADGHGHTWSATESSFLTASGRLLFHGDPRSHVEV